MPDPKLALRLPIALFVLGLASSAAADAIPANLPPIPCPRGAGGDRHSGACVPMPLCATNDDCPGYFDSCRDAPALCVERRTDALAHTPSALVHGECHAGRTCEPPSMCETGRRCIYDPEEERLYRAAHPEAAPHRACGGCSTCGGTDSEGGRSAVLRSGLGLVAIGLVLARRR